MLHVRARAPLRPTEDPERVKKAIQNMFPGAVVTIREVDVVSEGGDLERLRELIRNEQIPDSARSSMLWDISDDGSRARFFLGKQAAAAGKASFGQIRGPLGDIEVELISDKPGGAERAIYHAAPDTTVPPELAEVPLAERPAIE